MIVTRKLIFINFPKTGSSFVRRVLAETFKIRSNRRSLLHRLGNSIEKRLPKSHRWDALRSACDCILIATAPYRVIECFNHVRGYFDQHGKAHQVPKQLLHRRFVSVARDPLSRFCSYYHYFKTVNEDRHLPLLSDAIKSSGDPLSNISPEAFHDQLFWKHNCVWMQSAGLQDTIGPQTLDFVNHFAIDPIAAFREIGAGAAFDDVRKLFPSDFVLLNFESLAAELYALLKQTGTRTLPWDDPIWNERVLPDGIGGNFTTKTARDVLSRSLIEQIKREEWFLYDAYSKLTDSTRASELQSKAA